MNDGTQARGRGWALWKALITLVKALQANAELDSPRFEWRLSARHVVEEVLADHSRLA